MHLCTRHSGAWSVVLGESLPTALFCPPQPSPIKKERSPRPQSFCHSSSISPQDKLSLPGFSTPRDKQRLSYSAFTNQIFTSASTDSPTSPTTEAPPLPPRNAGKGTDFEKGFVTPSSKLVQPRGKNRKVHLCGRVWNVTSRTARNRDLAICYKHQQ